MHELATLWTHHTYRVFCIILDIESNTVKDRFWEKGNLIHRAWYYLNIASSQRMTVSKTTTIMQKIWRIRQKSLALGNSFVGRQEGNDKWGGLIAIVAILDEDIPSLSSTVNENLNPISDVVSGTINYDDEDLLLFNPTEIEIHNCL